MIRNIILCILLCGFSYGWSASQWSSLYPNYNVECGGSYGNSLYFGVRSYAQNPAILKVNPTTLKIEGNLTLPSEQHPGTVVISGQYGYFGNIGYPSQILKVDLKTFTLVSTLPLDYAKGHLLQTSLVVGNYAYFGGQGQNSSVVKVDLTTFTVVSYLINNQMYWLTSSAVFGNYAIFGGFGVGQLPAFAKVDLTTFTTTATYYIPGYTSGCLTFSVSGNYGYFGVRDIDQNSFVAKVNLKTLKYVGSVSLKTLGLYTSSVISGSYAYFGYMDVTVIDLVTFTVVTKSTPPAGYNYLVPAIAYNQTVSFGAFQGAYIGAVQMPMYATKSAIEENDTASSGWTHKIAPLLMLFLIVASL